MVPPFGCISHVQLTNTELATAFALASPPASACRVAIQALTQNVYMTWDTSTPSSTNGFTIYAGDAIRIVEIDPARLKFVRAAAGAVLNVAYLGPNLGT